MQSVPYDPATVSNYLRDNPGDVIGVFEQAATGFFAVASGPVLEAGMFLWGGLATIGVVQRGAAYALGGRLDASGLMRYLLTVAFVLGLLTFWNRELPGAGRSIPQLIAGQGKWLIDVMLSTALSDMLDQLERIWQTFSNGSLAGEAWALVGALVTGGAAVAAWTLLGPAVAVTLLFLAVVTFAMGLAQVVWSGVAISICVMFGPVLVPWLLWKPMEFLFWGWLKTLVTYSLYGAIAVAVVRVFFGAMLTQVETVVSQDWGSGMPQVVVSVVAAFLLALTAMVGTIKVPALANGLVSGSGAAGSGIAEAMGQAAGGRAAATTGAALAGAGAGFGGGGSPQQSLLGGQPLGVGGSRVAGAAMAGLAGGVAAVGQTLSGMAGGQLPLTKPQRGDR